MQIAFYGIARHVGTSANMAAVAAGLNYYYSLPVSVGLWKMDPVLQKNQIILTECTNRTDAQDIIKSCDLLVYNLSNSYQELETIYLRHSFYQKNIIFLIGKYYQDKPNELKQLARQYRMDLSRICAISYNTRFGNAYENRKVLAYIQNQKKDTKSCVDLEFEKNLKQTVNAVITYAKRKGEIYYG